LRRDFIGYGQRSPKMEWPRGSRLAVTFVLNYEAVGERSVAFGDDGAETFGEFPSYGGALLIENRPMESVWITCRPALTQFTKSLYGC
jgi:hypothetical protein